MVRLISVLLFLMASIFSSSCFSQNLTIKEEYQKILSKPDPKRPSDPQLLRTYNPLKLRQNEVKRFLDRHLRKISRKLSRKDFQSLILAAEFVKDFSASEKIAGAMLKTYPKNPDAICALVRVQINAKKFGIAEKTIVMAEKETSEYAKVSSHWALLAFGHKDQGNLRESNRCLIAYIRSRFIVAKTEPQALNALGFMIPLLRDQFIKIKSHAEFSDQLKVFRKDNLELLEHFQTSETKERQLEHTLSRLFFDVQLCSYSLDQDIQKSFHNLLDFLISNPEFSIKNKKQVERILWSSTFHCFRNRELQLLPPGKQNPFTIECEKKIEQIKFWYPTHLNLLKLTASRRNSDRILSEHLLKHPILEDSTPKKRMTSLIVCLPEGNTKFLKDLKNIDFLKTYLPKGTQITIFCVDQPKSQKVERLRRWAKMNPMSYQFVLLSGKLPTNVQWPNSPAWFVHGAKGRSCVTIGRQTDVLFALVSRLNHDSDKVSEKNKIEMPK